MDWTPGLPTPTASLDSAKGPAAAGRVRFQRFVLFRFSEGRGWIPAGVASQKTGPVAGDIARFARQHTKVAQKEPRIQWVRQLDPGWTLTGPRKPAARRLPARSSPEYIPFLTLSTKCVFAKNDGFWEGVVKIIFEAMQYTNL
jgi:hypothetical protein